MYNNVSFFVCGAPRSGTTYISDWITESEKAYCVHEVLNEVENMSYEEVVSYLRHCASTGKDRYGKLLQREFLKWNDLHLKEDPQILGIKQPVTWSGTVNSPGLIKNVLAKASVKKIVLLRHPIDVIASGKYRGIHTRNWPNYSVEVHCDLWITAYRHYVEWTELGNEVHVIFWEELVLDFEAEKNKIEIYLGIDLPNFSGYEHSASHFSQLRRSTFRALGVIHNPNRDLLSESEADVIRSKTSEICNNIGYKI